MLIEKKYGLVEKVWGDNWSKTEMDQQVRRLNGDGDGGGSSSAGLGRGGGRCRAGRVRHVARPSAGPVESRSPSHALHRPSCCRIVAGWPLDTVGSPRPVEKQLSSIGRVALNMIGHWIWPVCALDWIGFECCRFRLNCVSYGGEKHKKEL